MVTLFLGSAYAGPVIKISIHIGRRVDGCPGFGFCKAGLELKENGVLSNTTLQIDEAKKMIKIGINEQDLINNQQDKMEYFKGKRSVVFEEDFTFPDDVRLKSESKNSLLIRKGTYELEYIKGVYYISTPL